MSEDNKKAFLENVQEYKSKMQLTSDKVSILIFQDVVSEELGYVSEDILAKLLNHSKNLLEQFDNMLNAFERTEYLYFTRQDKELWCNQFKDILKRLIREYTRQYVSSTIDIILKQEHSRENILY